MPRTIDHQGLRRVALQLFDAMQLRRWNGWKPQTIQDLEKQITLGVAVVAPEDGADAWESGGLRVERGDDPGDFTVLLVGGTIEARS